MCTAGTCGLAMCATRLMPVAVKPGLSSAPCIVAANSGEKLAGDGRDVDADFLEHLALHHPAHAAAGRGVAFFLALPRGSRTRRRSRPRARSPRTRRRCDRAGFRTIRGRAAVWGCQSVIAVPCQTAAAGQGGAWFPFRSPLSVTAGCDRIIESKRRIHPEGQGARGIVAHHIRNLPDQLRLRIATGRARGGSEDAPGPEFAQASETSIGVRDLEQAPLAISQREAQTVNLGRSVLVSLDRKDSGARAMLPDHRRRAGLSPPGCSMNSRVPSGSGPGRSNGGCNSPAGKTISGRESSCARPPPSWPASRHARARADR